MSSHYYITTPLYYVNDKPHLGTAYCTIVADVLNRYHQFFGEKTLFLTGTDEHGQKCEQAAKARNLSPQEHCDDMSQNFIQTWKALNIDYDIFFRTTSPWHKKAVQKALQELYDKGDIYLGEYEGWYCVSEEIFYAEKDLVDGKTPSGKEVQKVKEKNYFFRMSKYQEPLLKHIQEHPHFIQPDFRRNEVLGFLKKPLNDLNISRPKSRLTWGVEIPFDKDYVTYVWFDALLNYVTALGYQQEGKEEHFRTWWYDAQTTHLLGKDILTTHAVYWPTMLMALGLPLPKTIFATGWILNKEKGKMSKSSGDVIAPLHLAEQVGVDPLRYFLVREIHLGNDAPFSYEILVNRLNAELSNNLGNLLSRTTNLIHKFFEGKVPNAPSSLDKASQELKDFALQTPDRLKEDILSMAPSYALNHVVELLNKANQYLEQKAPWKEAKNNLESAGQALYMAIETLRIAASLLSPVMPQKMAQLLEALNNPPSTFSACKQWGLLTPSSPVQKTPPLFPRLDLKVLAEH
ncbi:MAG: methionine--tRNA ligase [Bdellovibrio sp.]|nr:MAG: methionine--tRNA ligase [Bdellovibrio sp.]